MRPELRPPAGTIRASGRLRLLPGVRHRLQPLNVLKVTTLPLNVASRARVIGPLLDLGDPSLVIGSQQLLHRLNLWINAHEPQPPSRSSSLPSSYRLSST